MFRIYFLASVFSTVLPVENESIDFFDYFQPNSVKQLNFEIPTPLKAKGFLNSYNAATETDTMKATATNPIFLREEEIQTVKDSDKLVTNQSSNHNDTAPSGNRLSSRFNHEKWEEQKRLSEKIHLACVLVLVVIVIIGTAALAYIIRVTLLAREIFKSREVTHRFQPTADNMRTVDEVIDQFKTSHRASVNKQVQPLNISGMNQ